MNRLVVLLLAALSVPARAAGPEHRSGWILHAALFSGQFGAQPLRFLPDGEPWGDLRIELGALGLGYQAGAHGFLLSTRAVEFCVGPGSSDNWLSIGLAPLYAEYVTGVSDRWLSPRPALHAFVSIMPWPHAWETTWIRAGVGAKWRVFVVSPELELSYIHLQGFGGTRNAFSLFVKLELGGWWLLSRK